jgi:hypothetical protein
VQDSNSHRGVLEAPVLPVKLTAQIKRVSVRWLNAPRLQGTTLLDSVSPSKRRRESNPCSRLCRPLPSLSVTPPCGTDRHTTVSLKPRYSRGPYLFQYSNTRLHSAPSLARGSTGQPNLKIKLRAPKITLALMLGSDPN